MTTFTEVETFSVCHCAKCGVAFAITVDFENRRRSARDLFYCPAGHEQWFPGVTDKDRAQRLAGELDMERTRRRQAEKTADYATRARKAVSTRLRKVKRRIGRGVCPCCNRTFKQLAAHMEMKHPGYVSAGDQEPA